MWFLMLILGILIGHYVVDDVKKYLLFYRSYKKISDNDFKVNI